MFRRKFLSSALGASACALAARSARAASAFVDLDPTRPGVAISPLLHGHFIEHLGGVIYDGVWVGEDSRIPNVGGIRKALIDALKPLRPPVIRWPGGCFADSYNWRDGVGPRAARPVRTSFWMDVGRLAQQAGGPQRFEPNWFGTSEFVRFCRLSGAEPYIAGDVRSLPARDFYEWIDYCNSPPGSTTLARLREQGGDRDPFNVRLWGVGNESWGCGGEMTPEEYSTAFRRYTAWTPGMGVPLAFIASGPDGGAAGDSIAWTDRFFGSLAAKNPALVDRVWGWALHYYCGTAGKSPIDFTTAEWYELLAKANRMETLIERHWGALAIHDPGRHVKLAIDEWGAWHNGGTEPAPAYIFAQQSSLRDALIAGLTLDTFQRHPEKVGMACVAQMINCLHGLFLAYEDKFTVTPNYHVFAMYAAHQGGAKVPAVIDTEARLSSNQPALPELSGSASLKNKVLTLTLVHARHDAPAERTIRLRGASAKSVNATVLSHADLRAHNTFDAPRNVEPVQQSLNVSGPEFVVRFAPASVTKLEIELL
ncbi:MAG: alpha-N-arabinofuranosidase [Bryobacteraceae bacterium]